MEEKRVWQSAGGKATAIKSRKAALERYYKNPSRCLYCGKIIMVEENHKTREAKVKKFCNHTCAGIYNNTVKPKGLRKLISGSICNKCNKYFEYPSPSSYKRRICNDCKVSKQVRVFSNGKSNCKMCGKEIEHTKLKNYASVYSVRKMCNECVEKIDSKTKGECFANKKYWQMARSQITRHAKKVYKFNNGERKCFVCGYNTYVEVCHKKAVKDFEDSATIKEINNINNLVALCPNHHKELDLGLLKLDNNASLV